MNSTQTQLHLDLLSIHVIAFTYSLAEIIECFGYPVSTLRGLKITTSCSLLLRLENETLNTSILSNSTAFFKNTTGNKMQ